MIIRRKRKAFVPWLRYLHSLFGKRAGNAPQPMASILDQPAFEHLIEKERSRHHRRPAFCEFSLFQLIPRSHLGPDDLVRMVELLRQNLRITDDVGWLEERITALLPETDRDGAKRVANRFTKAAFEQGWEIDTEIYCYPWDDPIARKSEDVLPESEIETIQVRHRSADPVASANKGDKLLMHSKETPRQPPRLAHSVRQISTPFWKRLMDIVGAAAGLLLLSPLMTIAALTIKLTSPGPVIYTQMREGRNGRPFAMFKFRTMRADAEQWQDELRPFSEQDGPAFKIADDPRVTPVGRYLRKTCIDELPQFLNVLRGDMSLVGPRPLPVWESEQCKAWQRQRLLVKPGMTCSWQTRGKREVEFDDWMRMDLDYISQRGLFQDLKLIAKTFLVVFLHRASV